MAMEVRKLQRSRSDRMLFGVCGGLGSYFGLDSTLMRLIFVLVTVAWGAGIIAYIVLAIVVPEEPVESTGVAGAEGTTIAPYSTPVDRRMTAGLILVLIGVIFLLSNLGLIWWFDWRRFWPLILIAIGLAILLRRERR